MEAEEGFYHVATMQEVYRGKIHIFYNQVALLDVEAIDGYPEWLGDPDQRLAWGARGVSVACASDKDVEVVIYKGVGSPGGFSPGAGRIEVGNLGLNINSPTGDTDLMEWPAGKTSVAVYTDSPEMEKIKRVVFVLTPEHDGDGAQPRHATTQTEEEAARERAWAIINQFKDQDGYLRDSAASALSKLRKPAVPTLIEALTHADPHVREIAVIALGQLRDKQAVESLINVLSDSDPEVRWRAAGALGYLKDKRAVEPLISMLKDRNNKVRSAAADALGHLKDQRAVEPLINIMSDKHEDLFVLERTAVSLGNLGDERALPSLLNALVRGIDHLRYSVSRGIAALGTPPLPHLLPLLNHKDKGVRRWAVITLGSLRDPQAVGPLIAALSDKDSKVAASAATALGQIGGSEAVEAISKVINDRNKSGDIRYTAINALVQTRDESVAEVFIVLLRDGDTQVRRGAASALSQLGDRRTVEPLIAALDGQDVDTRFWIVNALGMLADSRAIPALERVSRSDTGRSSYGAISDAAEKAIKQIKRYGDKIAKERD